MTPSLIVRWILNRSASLQKQSGPNNTLNRIFVGVIFTILALPCLAADQRPRLFVLTDIENEPDDAQSLVRLLVHSSQYRIEGLVAVTSVWLPDRTAPQRFTGSWMPTD